MLGGRACAPGMGSGEWRIGSAVGSLPTDAHGEKFYEFGHRLAAHTPDFQTEQGYPKSAPGTANLSMSTNQLAERFGAVSMTLEMPFKDHDPNADTEFGWNGARSKRLAHAMLETLAGMIDEL